MSLRGSVIRATLLLSAVGTAALIAACSSSTNNDSSDSGSSGPPLCTSSGKDAFDTYGAPAFVAVNKSIFANVGSEVTKNGSKNLGDSFSEVGSGKPPSTSDGAATFEGKLAAFLVFVYGGPSSITYTDGKTYTGKGIDIVAAHTGLKITKDQYSYFIMNIVVPALTSNGVPTADVSSCFAPVVTASAFEDEVVGH